jgi:hypothetical protein
MSPTASEIVDFFKEAMKENRTVGRNELLGDTFTEAVSAGVSCLAALPSQVQELIPEPYSSLSNVTVEDMYASCMDPEDNCFDIKKFELLCDQRIREDSSNGHIEVGVEGDVQVEKYGRHGRRILTGDHYWLVLSRQKSALTHPFDPPPPFSDRLSELRPNRRLKVSRTMATAEPRPRSVWSSSTQEEDSQCGHEKEHIVRHESREVKHKDMGDLLKTQDGSEKSLLDVDYMVAFPEFRQRRKRKRQKKIRFDLIPIDAGKPAEVNGKQPAEKKTKRRRLDFDDAARMREYKLVLPPAEPPTNVEGYTPMLLLNQLSDAKMIGPIEWQITLPSPSSYASVDPHTHEHVQLVVRKGTDKEKSILSEDLAYEQDRDINHVSRRSLKHHLSSFALCDILGPQKRWNDMSFKELRNYLRDCKSQKVQSKK